MRISDWSSDVCSSDLIVSNHGGRQLDCAMSSIAALPAIADAVGSRIEVWMDGGIRSGQDVLKADAPAGPEPITNTRSEERRVGKECVRTGRSRWSPCH